MQRASVMILSILVLPACGGADGGSDAARNAVARTPSSAGELWETDQAGERAAAPASLVAFVHGLHVVVVDGDDLYAGATRRRLERGPDGGRTLTLPDSLQVRLESAGDDALELRFSTGERIPMRRRAPGAAGREVSR